MAVPGAGRPGLASFPHTCPFPRRVLFLLFSLCTGNWPTGERGAVGRSGVGKDYDVSDDDDDDDDNDDEEEEEEDDDEGTILGGVSQNLQFTRRPPLEDT